MRWAKAITVSAAIVCAAAPPAHAALLTATYYGIIGPDGFDYAGVWGAANSSLAGLPIKIVYDVDSSRGEYFYSSIAATTIEYRVGYTNDGPVLLSSITIGSTTVSWVPNNSSRVLSAEVTADPVFNLNGLSDLSHISYRDDGDPWQELFSTIAMHDMSLPFGIDATGGGVLDPAFVSDAYGIAAAGTGGQFPANRIYDWTVPYKITAFSIVGVPEPFTLSLFAVGLAGAAAMRRRVRIA